MTAEDEKLKYTITNKNRELQDKARQQEEDLKLEFAKKEEDYNSQVRDLEHKISDLGSSMREKEQTIKRHKAEKIESEADFWETVNRYARLTQPRPGAGFAQEESRLVRRAHPRAGPPVQQLSRQV